MNELRKDYLLDRWVIIASDRGKRPTDFVRKEIEEKPGFCYFCPGNEHTTPPEISRVEEGGKWIIRCFPNKYPATTTECGEIRENLLTKMPAYGRHEVVAETPNHGQHLDELSVDHLVKVLDMYSSRIKELKKDEKIRYVMVFKNQGKEAGASLDHSHTQIIALSVVPPLVKAETEAARKYGAERGSCPFCDIWRSEKDSERLIFEDENTIAFTPYASRFPFEAWIMPKRHVRTLEELSDLEKKSFAEMLKKILRRLHMSLNKPPYNFWLHHSPEDGDLHLHLELAPRLSSFAGMEYGSEVVINVIPPETAAFHYKQR
ncbi:MAG: galactose-1-phosphate uridylyltransferase [Candidatus Altiarchaeota archaeon]|nr:galactose-1-phosphate uridylyltransferase [Candidatus Altiarchaeota archaeon]